MTLIKNVFQTSCCQWTSIDYHGGSCIKYLGIDGTWSGIGGIGIVEFGTDVGKPGMTQPEPDLELVESGWKPAKSQVEPL